MKNPGDFKENSLEIQRKKNWEGNKKNKTQRKFTEIHKKSKKIQKKI